MDTQTIALLIMGTGMILVILVLAGLVLSARSFTQLAELIRFLGSLVVRHEREAQRRATTLSQETESDTRSVQQENIRIMREKE